MRGFEQNKDRNTEYEVREGGGDFKGIANQVKLEYMTVDCLFHKEQKPRRWFCVLSGRLADMPDILL